MPALERQLQTELNASWTVRRTGGAERRILKVCVLRRVVGAERKAVGYVPIRVIERVEELSVDVQPQPLVDRYGLQQGNVGVEQPWSAEENELSQQTGRGDGKNWLRIICEQFRV